MPNWCRNEVRISFKDEEQARDFIDKWTLPYGEPGLEDHPDYQDRRWLSFQHLLPLKDKEGNPIDWDYDIALDTWGTKWDVTFEDTVFERKDAISNLEIWMRFDTAWCPPEGVYKFLTEELELDVFWHYWEDGMQISGYLPD